jgi:hypothetical protein
MPADTSKNSIKDQPDLNEILLNWNSPSHPFKKRNRIFYQTVAAITFLAVVIVFFFNDILLIGVILSIAFVVYVISTVPPVEVEHKVTRIGYEHAGKLFRWMELGAFWFEEKWGSQILVIQTRLAFPGQIRSILGEMKKEKVKDIFGKYILFADRPPKNIVDSVSSWLSEKIPLETTV